MSKQKLSLFRGAATALVTPFIHGRLDFDALGFLIERQIDAGISALVLCGTTGESATLSDPEKIAVIAFAAERIRGRVPLIAGTGCADTAHTVSLSRAATAAGADALLVVTPYYNRPSQAGLVRHYLSVAESTDCPLILYNVPGRTGVSLSIESCMTLAEHPNIIALKEAGTDLSFVASLIAQLSDRLDIYAGNDELTVPTLALGGAGVISVVSNLAPGAVQEICRLWRESKPKLCAARAAKLSSLIRALFAESNPAPTKAALALLGLCREEIRLPLVPPNDATRAAIIAALQGLKKEIPEAKDF